MGGIHWPRRRGRCRLDNLPSGAGDDLPRMARSSVPLRGPGDNNFRCSAPITREKHTVNMRAVFSGTRLRPAVELNFSFYAAHPVTGQPLREWIRDIPGRAWVPERKTWTVTALGATPDKTLTDAGFTTVGPDDEPMSLAGYTAPLVTVDPEHPGFLCVYPRLAGQFHAAPQLPGTAIWRAEETRWLVSLHDLPGGMPKEFALTVEAAAALDAARAAPTAPDPARDQLLYDGTLDGLRGVPVTDLRNVDRATATAMSKLDITSVYDLLHHVPRRYIDRSNPALITSTSVGCKIAVLGTVDGVTSAQTRAGSMSKVSVRDTAGTAVFCTWFNATWITHRFTKGDLVVLHARLDTWTGKGGVEHFGMNNPLMDKVEATTAVMVPVYPASAKAEISTWALHRSASEAVARMGEISDTIPAQLLAERNLLDRTQAYTGIHLPTDPANAEAARRRLAYDELLALQLTLRNRRDAEGPEGSAAVAHIPTKHLSNQLIASLPFELTAAQRRVANEVARDMRAPTPMHRMIQGEVGSGKTVAMLIAMLMAVESGHQGAIMVPTEILAIQHHLEVTTRMAGLTKADGTPVRIELLTNKVTGAPRRAVLAGLAEGSIDIVIGTHALLAPVVTFASLSLAVIDEQHRFGVEQRATLRHKGPDGRTPDMLVATATPIPRTAVMSIFGDLEHSVLDEMPPGRSPITTCSVEATGADCADDGALPWQLIREQVAAGHQAFVVCPMVSDSETKTAAAAENTAAALGQGALRGLRIGVAHGKQPAVERTAVMAAFTAGELDVLVATTVIEVGVNVPAATVMVITGAERFGLAQMHQMRGRVGRGQWPGHCVLVGTPKTADAAQRIDALCASTDGFALAEVDLRIRGWGTLLGASQAGAATELRVADILTDTDLVSWARHDAITILEADPHLARRPGLRDEIRRAVGEDAAEWLTSA